MQQFYAQGKLLLTGEYTVLDGALALAIPTRQGQSMTVAENTLSGSLAWTSYDQQDNIWLALHWNPLQPSQLDVRRGDAAIAKRLIEILQAAIRLRGGDTAILAAKTVKTRLDFDRQWGLGSSSTLVHCLSSWLEVDAFALLEATFGGSGYDLACAAANGPILFQRQNGQPLSEEVAWQPEWLAASYFLYLNKKQNSREGIAHYRQQKVQPSDIAEISYYTAQLLGTRLLPMAKSNKEQTPLLQTLAYKEIPAVAPSLAQAMAILAGHEAAISRLSQQPTIQAAVFPDFPGQLKSLGAWGGDFVWVLSELPAAACRDYFHQRGYNTLLPWSALALS